MFPFLIGTVRTCTSVFFTRRPLAIWFPFLIGTVRTKTAPPMLHTIERMFPFLIGTVRTQQTMFYPPQVYPVSIPHRYGKNTSRYSTGELALALFPFLIGTVRTIIMLI